MICFSFWYLYLQTQPRAIPPHGRLTTETLSSVYDDPPWAELRLSHNLDHHHGYCEINVSDLKNGDVDA